MSQELSVPSKSAVRKAGSRLRKNLAGNDSTEATRQQVANDLQLLMEYRRCFVAPMVSMSGDLEMLVRMSGMEAEVTRRIKRMQTIVEKITERERGLDLSRMEDLGGCRVVLESNSIEDLEKLVRCVENAWAIEIVRKRDYVSEPRKSGYRAVHIVLNRFGLPIEVQLRTSRMHHWADTMESLSDLLGENFKQDGDTAIHRFMKMRQMMESMGERSVIPSEEFMNEFRERLGEASDLVRRSVGDSGDDILSFDL